MKKAAALMAVMAVVGVSGCTAVTTMDRSGFYDEFSGQYYAVNTVTVRDRTGTDMHHVMVMDDKNKLFSHATGSGRGICAGMTDGIGSSLVQAGGMIGAAAVWPGQNNNTTSGAAASQSQGQDQGQVQGQMQGQVQGQAAINKNTNTNINRNSNRNTNLNSNVNANNNCNQNRNDVRNTNANTNLNCNTNTATGGSGWTPPGQQGR